MKAKATEMDQLNYEQAYAELEKIVQALEENPNSLEEVLVLFARGKELAEHCGKLLDEAELKVRQLTGSELEAGDEG
mgnify:CR=1 FL=1